MKVEITATAKEIAGLVLALQGQRGTGKLNLPDGKTLTRYLFQADLEARRDTAEGEG